MYNWVFQLFQVMLDSQLTCIFMKFFNSSYIFLKYYAKILKYPLIFDDTSSDGPNIHSTKVNLSDAVHVRFFFNTEYTFLEFSKNIFVNDQADAFSE